VCLYLVVRWHDLHARPGIAYGTAAAMVVVTAVIGWLAVTGRCTVRPSSSRIWR
jgi:hypothetical protein